MVGAMAPVSATEFGFYEYCGGDNCAGDVDIVVTGEKESMPNASHALTRVRFEYRMGNSELVDTIVNDAL